MKKYTKTHESRQALEAHVEKIEKREGGCKTVGKKITYIFPEDNELPPDIEQMENMGKVTYRGSGYSNLTRIKVRGKEYFISKEKFRELGGIQKIRFDAPYRRLP
jgi:hypothetical protein